MFATIQIEYTFTMSSNFICSNSLDIAELIEGEVYISKVPVDQGHTNRAKGERITGLNTENAEDNEGLLRYDILFKVKTSVYAFIL